MQTVNKLKQFHYLDIITAFFVTILLISNIASVKITSIGFFTFDAGTILFPLTYIFGDIFTEVYGYSRARKMIWIGFACNILMGLIILLVQSLPPAAQWNNQQSFEAILGLTPRIVFASMIAYLVGEFLNSFVLAKIKVATKGKALWFRTIISTLVGEFFDTFLFVFIAFYGLFTQELLITILLSNYIFKVLVEILFTPITYAVVAKLKHIEKEDFYDEKTNFTPFSLNSKSNEK